MKVLSRALVYFGALAAVMLAFGFVLFATTVMRDPVAEAPSADGIVVLTGGEARIQAGVRLLQDARGKRLLISGVNRETTRKDIQRISGIDSKLLACCVDLGYEALDTVGNADEARTWAHTHGYATVILVTSSYHMPRSLAELALAMPDVQVIPHAVTPRNFPDTGWWLHVKTTRLLLSEYLKYLPAAARLATQKIMGWRDTGSLVLAQPKPADG
jgi:uncharacterized SAM-binding protein YcdF (DUF218 family)